MTKTTRQGTSFAPLSDPKKKQRRRSKEGEEGQPAAPLGPAHKEGGDDKPLFTNLMEVDDTSKQEESEGGYPPKQKDEEDEPEDLETLGPILVLDPVIHDYDTQEEADIWRDGVLRKRAWMYYWDKRIAKEIRGGILGIPNDRLPCYERVARAPYFKPFRAKEAPKARKNASPSKGGAAAREPFDVTPHLIPALQR